MEEKDVFIIGVSGPSGSGKSSLVKKFLSPFLKTNGYVVRIIHGDGCFQGRKCKLDEDLGLKNVEVPEAYNYKNMLNRIKRHKNEFNEMKQKEKQKEDEMEGEEEEEEDNVKKKQVQKRSNNQKLVILIEGFLMFCGPEELLSKMDVKLFLFANKPTLYERRKNRRKRKNLVLFKKYYEKYVWPCYLEHHQTILSEIDTEHRQKGRSLDKSFFYLENNQMFALETEKLEKDDVFVHTYNLLFQFLKNI